MKDGNWSKEELLETLWTNDIPERSVRQLYNGIYYIRKTLKEYGITGDLISLDSNYCMRLGDVDYDIKSFYELENGGKAYGVDDLQKLEQLYTGDYLGSEYYEWASNERERVVRIYQSLLFRLSAELIREKNWEKAETCLLKAYNKNPYHEGATARLLEVYLSSGDVRKALIHYNAYEKLLKSDLGIVPSKRIKDMVKALK